VGKKAWPHALSLLAILLVLWAIKDSLDQARSVDAVPYSVFEQYLRDGRISEIEVGDRVVSGKLRTPHDGKTDVIAVVVEPAMAERLSRYDVPYRRVRGSNWLTDILSWIGPTLLLFGLWYAMSRKLGSKGGMGLLGIGQSKAEGLHGEDHRRALRRRGVR